MNEDKLNVDMNRDVDMCRLIMDYAQYISRIAPPGTPLLDPRPNARQITADDVRESACLCFLALDFVQERGRK